MLPNAGVAIEKEKIFQQPAAAGCGCFFFLFVHPLVSHLKPSPPVVVQETVTPTPIALPP